MTQFSEGTRVTLARKPGAKGREFLGTVAEAPANEHCRIKVNHDDGVSHFDADELLIIEDMGHRAWTAKLTKNQVAGEHIRDRLTALEDKLFDLEVSEDVTRSGAEIDRIKTIIDGVFNFEGWT